MFLRGRGVDPIVSVEKRGFGKILREKAKGLCVQITDRVMVTDLIKREGKVFAAMGFATETNDFHVFKTKAIVMCSVVPLLSLMVAGFPISR